MTKLSRKLLFSILSVALAFITLGATTFAWFTLNTVADIDTIETNITAGTGIEISLDGQYFRNTIRIDDLVEFLGKPIGSYKFDDLTSPNGIGIYDLTLENSTTGNKVQQNEVGQLYKGTKYIEFPLWFRSPTKDARVFLLTGTTLDSDPVLWTSDAQFTYTGRAQDAGDVVQVGDTISIYAADAIRFSFQDYELSPGDLSLTSGGTAKVFELDPTGRANINAILGSAPSLTNGMIPYFNEKSDVKITQDTLDDFGQLPGIVYRNGNLVDTADLAPEDGDVVDVNGDPAVPIVTLSVQKTGDQVFYYGYTVVRIWLEGWDPDCFNAVLGKPFSLTLVFGGGKPASAG